MPTRSLGKWQSRRKVSLGPLRRACPASGATWNVQVVRGKMTSKCLWHACRALAIGLLLMVIGAGMATIGYYAEHISPDTFTKSNLTIRIKSESKSVQLHNLSYAGPIVMGCGGFIIVAACVMTFEARESAAKVVPTRFKLSIGNRNNAPAIPSSNSSSRRLGFRTKHAVGSQTSRWGSNLGVFRYPSGDSSHSKHAISALVHYPGMTGSPKLREKQLIRSGSVPNLKSSSLSSPLQLLTSPIQINHARHRCSNSASKHSRSRHPNNTSSILKSHRYAVSVDETSHFNPHKLSLGSNGSHHSINNEMAQSISTTANKRDHTKRSDTAKRHILSRQKPVDNYEIQLPGASNIRSQLSICSEPDTIRRLSSQSNSEPNPKPDHEKREIFSTSRSKTTSTETQKKKHVRIKRPNTLSLKFKRDEPFKDKSKCSRTDNMKPLTKTTADISGPPDPKAILKKEAAEDQIYVISQISNKDNEYYDSIEVIDERRMKMLSKMDPNRLYEANSSICEEYYLSSTSKEQKSDKSVENVDDNQSNDELTKT